MVLGPVCADSEALCGWGSGPGSPHLLHWKRFHIGSAYYVSWYQQLPGTPPEPSSIMIEIHPQGFLIASLAPGLATQVP